MVGPVAHAIVGYSGGVWPPEQSRHREDWSMSESTTIRYVGLDVHRDSIAIAVAVADGRPAESLGAVPNDIPKLIKRLLRPGPAASQLDLSVREPTDHDRRARIDVLTQRNGP